ncbi:MAG: hypothetical protein J7647_05550 [Cyanobacteria bacterium SBLK]|nr:hypothetical protein [Cyanobacteria bacterium SBLK]
MSSENEKNEVTIRVKLDGKLRDRFKGLTAMEGTNMNAVVVEFIEKYVKEKSEK